ncbi:MAG: TldD/PmbA family protein [Planctomycetota bacterium]
MNESDLLDLARRALACTTTGEAEVNVSFRDGGLTRFANNHIHQNVAGTDVSVTLRVVEDGRIGVASTNRTDPDGLAELAERAGAIACHVEPTPHFAGLPGPAEVPSVEAVDERTAGFGPEGRAGVVAHLIEAGRSAGATAAGSLETTLTRRAVVNSRGASVSFSRTAVRGTAMLHGDTGSAYDEFMASSVDEVDVGQVADYLVDRYRSNRDQVEIEPRRYTVVLEPKAVAVLVQMTAWIGFGGAEFHEGRSFMADRIGEQVMGSNITIVDDGLDCSGLPMPFDAEGVPRQRVVLVERGVARSVVWDSLYGARHGVPSTGHATSPGSGSGPLPTNLFVEPGCATMDEMIASVDHGLLVSRFHYTNVAEPMKAVLTGMTRDGTFLVEGGRVTRAVKNLRFTQSMLEAFSNVTALTAHRCNTGVVAPGMTIEGFHFTGKTGF